MMDLQILRCIVYTCSLQENVIWFSHDKNYIYELNLIVLFFLLLLCFNTQMSASKRAEYVY